MSESKNFVDIYKDFLKDLNPYKKHLKSIESMKRKVEKKQILATEEEINRLEQITDDEEFSSDINKIYNFSNGDRYIGKVEKNELSGNGYYIMYEDDEVIMEYLGEFKNNLREGIGQCSFSNGNMYLGIFKEDLMDGIGHMKYSSGDEYIGQWKNGKKHGKGIFTWSDGVIYNGDFNNGKMEGIGICYDNSGNIIYDGEWKNNLIHGKGTYIWNEGKKYVGEFLHGKKHGYGAFYLNGELIYDGTWKFDKPSVFGRTLEELFSIKL